MTNEEAIEIIEGRNFSCIECIDRSEECCKALEMAIQALTAISELSKKLKAVNRYDMDEKVLIGFNMAVAIFNKCFGESCALKNEQTDGDLISRNDVIKMFNTMDRYRADKLILQDTDREFPSNEVFIVDDCYELLEQLPTYSAEQADGDLISRQAVIGIVDFECGEWKGLARTIVKAIEQMPSAEKTAEWGECQILTDEIYFKKTSWEYECSNCGYINEHETNYCPNCGRKMLGEQTE